jgi:hypothetical protein
VVTLDEAGGHRVDDGVADNLLDAGQHEDHHRARLGVGETDVIDIGPALDLDLALPT